MSTEALPQELPAWEDTLTRVPYWIFQRTDVYDLEQEKIFRGPNWNYLCLESELSTPGSYCSTFVGNTPVIVTRDRDGELYAFENRCAHRGALLALDKRGEAKDFTCVYHAWTYNLQGDLTGVAFKDGVRGEGGMPANFCWKPTDLVSFESKLSPAWCLERFPKTHPTWKITSAMKLRAE